jgi:outer membrane protein assembly factor BamB
MICVGTIRPRAGGRAMAAGILSGMSVSAAAGQPVPAWEDRYNGPDSSVDLAWTSVLDSQGNLIVGASSPASNGAEGFITLKYSPTGQRLWERRVDGSGSLSSDRSLSVAVDGEGNVYSGGFVDDAATAEDGVVAKYAPDGTPLWTREIDFMGLGDGVARVLVHPDGSLYAVGTTYNGTFGHDTAMFIMRLNPETGATLWSDTFEHAPQPPGSHNAPDVVHDAVLDADGNVVFVGITGIAPTFDFGLRQTVLKYTPEGIRAWVFRDTEDVHHFNGRTHMKTGPGGDAFVVYARGPFDQLWDSALMKVSGVTGQMAWKRSFDGVSNDTQRPIDTLFDFANDRIVIFSQVFIIGGFPVDENLLIIGYDTAGNLQWSRRWMGTVTNSSDTAQAIVGDGAGGFIILGSTGNGPSFNYTDIDWLLQRYSLDGGVLDWSYRFGNVAPAVRSYRGKDLQIDLSRRSLLVVGESAPVPLSAEPPSFDITAARFDLPGGCYANCDASTAPPALNVSDFTCFLQRYAAGDSYANCDASTVAPVLNVSDFTCFLQSYAEGCP